MFVPDEALEELFGFVSRQCKVIYEGRELDSLRKLNDKFWDYAETVSRSISDCE